MPKTRPVVFIGSSGEGIKVAQALQLNLDRDAEVILWSQGVFGLSEGTLESLVDKLDLFDFAILVLTPDDLTVSRGDEKQSPRDNVVFELGLFMGGLGRSRTFIVHDRTVQIKLPSDLAGITPATYAPPSAGTLQSALGACSTTIESAISAQGVRARAATSSINPNVEFKVLASLLEAAAHQFLILMAETGAKLDRGGPLVLGSQYVYASKADLRGGVGHGYFSIDKLCQTLADAELLTVDLRNQVGLTERGREFAEWLKANGFKAEFFNSWNGGWGTRPEKLSDVDDPKTAPRTIYDLAARAKQAEKEKAASTDSQKAKE